MWADRYDRAVVKAVVDEGRKMDVGGGGEKR